MGQIVEDKDARTDDSRSDQYRYPYEPTQYLVLERLVNSGLISKKNTVLDYGTGKGRVCFYLSYQRDADLSVWNMMSVFLVQQNLTENMRYRAEEYLLS